MEHLNVQKRYLVGREAGDGCHVDVILHGQAHRTLLPKFLDNL
jgi:hypothetical protein